MYCIVHDIIVIGYSQLKYCMFPHKTAHTADDPQYAASRLLDVHFWHCFNYHLVFKAALGIAYNSTIRHINSHINSRLNTFLVASLHSLYLSRLYTFVGWTSMHNLAVMS